MSPENVKGRHLLILITQLELGGAQKIAIRLAEFLLEQGYRVTLATFYDKENLIPTVEKQYAFELLDLQAQRHSQAGKALEIGDGLQLLRSLWQLYRYFRQERVEILLSFTHYSNIFGPLVAKLAGVGTRIASQRSLLADRSELLRWLHGQVLASKLVHHVVAVSEPVKAMYVDTRVVPAEKVTVIHNGIDVERYQKKLAAPQALVEVLPAGAFVIMTVARLEHQKGHHTLLEAACLLCQEHANLFFVWVGDGPEAARLKAAVVANGLSERIYFAGSQDNVAAWLGQADLFVLPSLAEGMPNALLEAMAAGVPVIASAVGGVLDVLTDDTMGLRVPAGESYALTKGIDELIHEPEKRKSMGDRGRCWIASNFMDSKMRHQFRELIRFANH